jgi:hypothetical protein
VGPGQSFKEGFQTKYEILQNVVFSPFISTDKEPTRKGSAFLFASEE